MSLLYILKQWGGERATMNAIKSSLPRVSKCVWVYHDQRPCMGCIYTQNHSMRVWGTGVDVPNLLISYDRHRLYLILRGSSCGKLVHHWTADLSILPREDRWTPLVIYSWWYSIQFMSHFTFHIPPSLSHVKIFGFSDHLIWCEVSIHSNVKGVLTCYIHICVI